MTTGKQVSIPENKRLEERVNKRLIEIEEAMRRELSNKGIDIELAISYIKLGYASGYLVGWTDRDKEVMNKFTK